MVEWTIDTFSILCVVIVAVLVCIGAVAFWADAIRGTPLDMRIGPYFLWAFACGGLAICFLHVWRE